MKEETESRTIEAEQSAVRAEDYLLKPEDEDDDYGFLAPIREKALVEPLIGGVKSFRAMEEAIASAEKSVHLAYWVFSPGIRLQSPKVKRLKVTRRKGCPKKQKECKVSLKTWADLLEYVVVERHAELRIILTDFEPLYSHHRDTWSAYRQLCRTAARLRPLERRRFQVICSLHKRCVKEVMRWSGLSEKVKNFNRLGIKAAKKRLRNMPGLWRDVQIGTKVELDWIPSKEIHPASHHQKICIVDGTTAFCGGMDVAAGRLSPLWHDVQCRVTGGPVGDIQRNFVARWKAEVEGFQEFIQEANEEKLRGVPKLPSIEITEMKQSALPVTTTPGQAFAQVHRTLSSPVWNLRSDIKEVYEKAIRQARTYVYIENQYLRERDVADWLIERREEVQDLQVIIVLPVGPEEIKVSKASRKTWLGKMTAHGIALQYEALTELRDAFRDEGGEIRNLGLYSMVHKRGSGQGLITNSCGSRQIYVHSKVLIVDDVFCSIGSANVTPRSFEMDTELNVSWVDRDSVRKFRLELWAWLLGLKEGALSKWDDSKKCVEEWNKIAKYNKSALSRGKSRQGFIVPHDINHRGIYPGEKIFMFPDEYAGLVDLDSESIEETVA